MKAKYLFLAMTAIVLGCSMTACSSDDDDVIPTPEPRQKTALSFDADTVQVGVGESVNFNIKEGGGDYKVISENPDIAEATVSGTAVTINSQKKGLTGIVISDAAGNYKRVVVKSMYFKLTLDKEAVTVNMKLGQAKAGASVQVVNGNGQYTTSSDKPEICTATVRGDSEIYITGKKTGEATITVTDLMGLTATIKVTCNVSTVAYTEEEKAEIMSKSVPQLTWDGRRTAESNFYLVKHDVVEDGRQRVYLLYGSSWFESIYNQFLFEGDFSVGKKTNGAYIYDTGWSTPTQFTENVDVEIIKNDGNMAWGIISVIAKKNGEDYLYYGSFCVKL